jgi:hypothetical protein
LRAEDWLTDWLVHKTLHPKTEEGTLFPVDLLIESNQFYSAEHLVPTSIIISPLGRADTGAITIWKLMEVTPTQQPFFGPHICIAKRNVLDECLEE